MNAGAIINTYRDALDGNLAALIRWDTMRLTERQRDAILFPSPTNRRRVRYMERKIASMKNELTRNAA